MMCDNMYESFNINFKNIFGMIDNRDYFINISLGEFNKENNLSIISIDKYDIEKYKEDFSYLGIRNVINILNRALIKKFDIDIYSSFDKYKCDYNITYRYSDEDLFIYFVDSSNLEYVKTFFRNCEYVVNMVKHGLNCDHIFKDINMKEIVCLSKYDKRDFGLNTEKIRINNDIVYRFKLSK